MVASGEGTSPTATVGGDEFEDVEPSAGWDLPTMPSSSTPLPAPAPRNTKACRNSCLSSRCKAHGLPVRVSVIDMC